MHRWVLLALGSLILAAAPAQAGKVTIDFDFTGSTVSLLGGSVVVPPDGMVTAGSGRLTLDANDVTEAVEAGRITLESMTLGLTLSKSFGTQAIVMGTIAGNQTNRGIGQLTGALTTLVFNLKPQALYTGTVNCTGTGCGFLGTFPVSINTVLKFLGTLGVTNVNSVGSAGLTGSIPFSLAGFTGTIQLAGVETSRTFVPEPASFGLLAVGLLATAAVARLRTRR